MSELSENQKRKIVKVELLETFAEISDVLYGSPMGASGINHAQGQVPDPGETAGTDKYLCEDGTWKTPTKSLIGLENVGNFKAVSTEASQGLSSTEQSNARANIGAGTSSLVIGTTTNSAADGKVVDDHINNTSNPHNVTKSLIGLGDVTNDAQVKRTEMGVANGVATLGNDSLIPSNLLPSYVDDIIEGYYKSDSDKFYTTLNSGTYSGEITSESGKVYVDKSTNATYRWSGSAYVLIKGDIVIGTAQGNAADGKVVNDHINNTSNPHGVTKTLVGLGNVGNFKAVSTEASLGLSSTELSNARANIGAGTSSLTIGTTGTTALKGDTKYAASNSAGGDAINADKVDGYHIVVVTEMPASPDANTIYIVK